MPNWCNNKLAVYGPHEDVKRFQEQAVGHSPWHTGENPNVLNFHSLVPIPAAVIAAGYEAAGYDWERNHWGCKWGACHAEVLDEWEGHLTCAFDTAWSPPLAFLEKLGPQWPTLIFLLDYEEMGMGFKGLCKIKGEVVEDHCVTL
ncbi:MAG: hypothetical protein HY298_20905 [Verrucomicrobia bacterium]|nr:hypothetical protein [Verrucomicrobiota bacterium]